MTTVRCDKIILYEVLLRTNFGKHRRNIAVFVTQNIYLGKVVFVTSWDFADAYMISARNIRYGRV